MDRRIEEYHRRANICEELASTTQHHDTRQQLLDLAEQWRDLTIRIEMLEAAGHLAGGRRWIPDPLRGLLFRQRTAAISVIRRILN
jgi:hypothetical protein